MARRLTLRKEGLGELTTDDLRAVVAGAREAIATVDECPFTGPYPSLPLRKCLSTYLTG